MIRIQELSRNFGDLRALDRLTFDILPGRVFGYLGPNGAGKTTTLRILMGLLRPSSGSVTVLGLDPVQQREELNARVGYLADNPFLYDEITGVELLHFIADLHGLPGPGREEIFSRWLTTFDLKDRAGTPIGEYSLGMRKKIALVSMLIRTPDCLILDEPGSGLDPESQYLLRSVLKSEADRGVTVFLSTHQLAEAQVLCDTLAVLRAGRIVAQGTLEDLKVAAGAGPDQTLEEVYMKLSSGAATATRSGTGSERRDTP